MQTYMISSMTSKPFGLNVSGKNQKEAFKSYHLPANVFFRFYWPIKTKSAIKLQVTKKQNLEIKCATNSPDEPVVANDMYMQPVTLP